MLDRMILTCAYDPPCNPGELSSVPLTQQRLFPLNLNNGTVRSFDNTSHIAAASYDPGSASLSNPGLNHTPSPPFLSPQSRAAVRVK
jgi:hypothetical protein